MFCRVCNVLAIFGDKKYGAESSFRDQNRRPVLNLFLEKSRFRESLDEHFHLGMNHKVLIAMQKFVYTLNYKIL